MFNLSLASLQYNVVNRFIETFYSCEDNSNRPDIFDQSNIPNYDR